MTEEAPEVNQPGQSTRGGLRVKSEYLPRQAEALKRMTAGEPFEQIAEDLGYADRSGAYRAAMAALSRQTMQDADEVRVVELRRTEELLAAIWPIATWTPPPIDEELGGDEFDAQDAKAAAARALHQLEAVKTTLKVLDRRAKYFGLDAPQKHEVKAEITSDADVNKQLMEWFTEQVESGAYEDYKRSKAEQGSNDRTS